MNCVARVVRHISGIEDCCGKAKITTLDHLGDEALDKGFVRRIGHNSPFCDDRR